MTYAPTAPGWYDDPDDPSLLRYFDGVLWSAHTAPRRSPTAEQSTIGRVSDAPDSALGPGQSVGVDGFAPTAQPLGSASSALDGSPWMARNDVLADGAVLAPWWRRLLARVLDSLLNGVITTVLGWPFVEELVAVLGRYVADVAEATERGAAPPDQNAFAAAVGDVLLPVTIIGLMVALVYEIGFLRWRGATPGKTALGMQVRRVGAPGRLTFSDAARRQVLAVGTTIVGLVPFVGLIATVVSVLDPAWLLWDPKRQTLHDKMADTVVVIRPGREDR
ncbi:MAG: RDD family protein [Dermatophilaceae bacterium]